MVLERREYTSESVANVNAVNTIYVYCNVIEHRMVSHTLALLIGVLPVTGNPSACVSKRYDKIQCNPALKKNLCDIYISICDNQAKRIHFCKGKLIVTLHLREKNCRTSFLIILIMAI